MSSSPTPFKHVASGDGAGEKKRKRIEEYGEEWADLIDDSDDEKEDANTAAPVDEAIVESTETKSQGLQQTAALDAKFAKVKKQAIELKEERKRLQKEISLCRSKTKALKIGTQQNTKARATVDRIVKENGRNSSKEEVDFLKNIKNNLIVLTRELDDPLFTSLMQQAFPDKLEVVPDLRPFRSDRTEDEYNEDEPLDGGKADDEDRSFSSSVHEDSEAAIEPEKERGHEFKRVQELGHRASASDPGNEHQDALFAYIERQRHKLSKSAREGHGPRARAERQ
ncbi:hypothetical protein KC343_g1241 [Hortaea werneckii]|nr:hypothetical protein KC352_g6350 [Hortaea werneckii]KAI7571712.1 hypothetical protein KC317_g1401 [Hortaea werneckii]KAI7626616.1 hypothetical protein KC346_g1172 [Hortaea werneckii]KAI7636538.1 hypothetical protein KC343_g1241 [Hortaea werneckii]KAI7682165.1 hypothetical protein KC319_g1163 [Hortaea werneckii]